MTVVLKAIFHEKTRVILLSFIGAKDDESSGAVSPAKLLSSCHHQQTNTHNYGTQYNMQLSFNQMLPNRQKGIFVHTRTCPPLRTHSEAIFAMHPSQCCQLRI